MEIVDKQSAGIIADELGGAIIGCYSLVEDLTKKKEDSTTIEQVSEAIYYLEKAQDILTDLCEQKNTTNINENNI